MLVLSSVVKKETFELHVYNHFATHLLGLLREQVVLHDFPLIDRNEAALTIYKLSTRQSRKNSTSPRRGDEAQRVHLFIICNASHEARRTLSNSQSP